MEMSLPALHALGDDSSTSVFFVSPLISRTFDILLQFWWYCFSNVPFFGVPAIIATRLGLFQAACLFIPDHFFACSSNLSSCSELADFRPKISY